MAKTTPLPKYVLVFKEHHGERFFTYTTDYEKYVIVASMAAERLKLGYMYDKEPKGQPDMFKPTAHLSDSDRVKWHLDRIRHNKDRNDKPVEFYLKSLYRWMDSRGSGSDEEFYSYPLETPTLKIAK